MQLTEYKDIIRSSGHRPVEIRDRVTGTNADPLATAIVLGDKIFCL